MIKEWSTLFSVSNTLSYQMVTHLRMTGNALEKGQAPLVKLALVSVVLKGAGSGPAYPPGCPEADFLGSDGVINSYQTLAFSALHWWLRW